MLRIYRRLWHVTWAEQWQYRANTLMYLLYWLVSPIVYLSVWTAIATAQGSVSGRSANDFATYYLVLLVVDVLASEITVHILAYKIQDGTLSNELLKPIHPILTGALVQNLAFKALTFGALVPIWLVLNLLFRPDFSAVTAGHLLVALPVIAAAFLMDFLLGAALTCVAFWTTRVWAIHEFYYAFYSLLSGQFVPLDLMPPAVQSVARYLPFQLGRYFPVQLILGKLTPQEIALNCALLVFWLVLLALIFSAVWRRAIRRFSAVGA